MLNIGQLIMTGISGLTITEEEKKFIESENIGGVILFAHNFESPAQLAELVNSIQVLRKEYPLFIAVDHEGGRIMRFKKYFTQFPAMAKIAKIGSPKICYTIHQIMAEELKSCGINLSFSPCCDVLSHPENKVIGDRSFGTTPDEVARYASSAIRGLQTNGVMACAKHYPGHGATNKDSHFSLPIVKMDGEKFWNQDVAPFVKAVKSRVEFVMTGHLIIEHLDATLPASLSQKILNLLRNELRYSKIIICDDLEMKAVSDNYSVEEAAVMALEAGTDIVLFKTINTAMKSYEHLQNALKTKRLKNTEINEKIERVMDCKIRNLKDYNPIYIPSISNKINSKSTQIFLDDINRKLTGTQSNH